MTPQQTGGDRPSEHIEGVSYVPHFHPVRDTYRTHAGVVIFGCAGEFRMSADPIVPATKSDNHGKRTTMCYIGIDTRARTVAAVILGLVALAAPTAVEARGGFGGFHGGGFGGGFGGFHGGGFGWGGRGYGGGWSGGFYPGYYGWGYGGYPYAYYWYAYPYSTYPYYGY